MGANKIVLNGKVLIDLTQDDTEEDDVRVGKKFHKSNGEPSVGTAVLGGGSVECNRKHVIEVDELPTENIDENALYELVKKRLVNIIIFLDGIRYAYGSLVAGLYYEQTKPTDNINISNDENTYIYYIADENDIFAYGYIEEMGTNGWLSLSQGAPLVVITDASEAIETNCIYALIEEGDEYYQYGDKTFLDIKWDDKWLTDTLRGIGLYYATTKPANPIGSSTLVGLMYYIEDENSLCIYDGDMGEWHTLAADVTVVASREEATGEGLYVLIREWHPYIKTIGQLVVTEGGTYDVTDKERVVVDMPEYIIFGTWNLYDIGEGYFYFDENVNFTTVINGETVNCVGIEGDFTDYYDPSHLWYTREDNNSSDEVFGYNGWNPDYGDKAHIVDFGKEPQVVSSVFYRWITTYGKIQ